MENNTSSKPKKRKAKKEQVYPTNHGKPHKKGPAKHIIKAAPFDPAIHKMVKIGKGLWKQVTKDDLELKED